MRIEHMIGVAGSAFISVSALVMLVALRRGKRLCRELRDRYPQEFAALGSPMPALLNSPTVTAYYRFLIRGDWSRVSDMDLRRRFGKLRRFERALLTFVCTGLVVFAIAVLLTF